LDYSVFSLWSPVLEQHLELVGFQLNQPTMVTTCSKDAKGALEHIASVVMVHNAKELQAAFTAFDVNDVHDFMSIDNMADFFESSFPVEETNEDGTTSVKQVALSLMTIKKLILLQQWYAAQNTSDFSVWYNLTADAFNDWRTKQALSHVKPPSDSPPVTSTTVTATSPMPTFRQNIKINVSDYSKLKEDHQWRTFHRLLKATAASHDTLDVLNPDYVPPSALAVVFDQQ
jgi:hypothetical protein